MSTETKEFIISNKLGMHARPAAQFVKRASKFSCNIWVEKDDEQVNGKSIMGLMMLAAGHGAKILITAEGSDSEEAIKELGSLIQSGFDDGE
ncbi:HPr family phosphocarrier protein [soil metagenome]